MLNKSKSYSWENMPLASDAALVDVVMMLLIFNLLIIGYIFGNTPGNKVIGNLPVVELPVSNANELTDQNDSRNALPIHVFQDRGSVIRIKIRDKQYGLQNLSSVLKEISPNNVIIHIEKNEWTQIILALIKSLTTAEVKEFYFHDFNNH